jgi:hypothetical protein
LKVAVNAVSDEKLRSVERSNIGAAIRDYSPECTDESARGDPQTLPLLAI